jgi:hypothetical protein
MDALWLLVTGNNLIGGLTDDDEGLSDMLPLVRLDDGIDIRSLGLIGDEEFSHAELFDRTISGNEDTPEALLIHARVELLVARVLRSIDPEHVKKAGRALRAARSQEPRDVHEGDGRRRRCLASTSGSPYPATCTWSSESSRSASTTLPRRSSNSRVTSSTTSSPLLRSARRRNWLRSL